MEKKIYSAINAIQADLAKTGISKDRKNQQQGYAFRGIDDVYTALAPLLAEHKVCIFPRVTERTCTERQSARGGLLFCTTVHCEFDFVSAEDGSTHTCITYGEAMDSADKSTNKAMSAAYKYACLQTFCIPTEGDNDADASTPGPRLPQPTVEVISEINACATVPQIKDVLRKYNGYYDRDGLSKAASARKAILMPPAQANSDAMDRLIAEGGNMECDK